MRFREMLVAALLLPSAAAAQPFGGYEASLHGPRELARGRANLLHGRLFEVRGVSRLRPWARGQVRVRWVGTAAGAPLGPWATARADADGHFRLFVEVPRDATSPSELEVRLGDGELARTLRHPVQIAPTEELLLRTDRRFYQPGETVHVWALLRDGDTGVPLAGRTLHLRGQGGSDLPRLDESVRTGDSGVAYASFELPSNEPSGAFQITAELDENVWASLLVEVGLRTSERLLVDLRWPETNVAPGALVHPVVEVRSLTGAPVRGARVSLRVGEDQAPRTLRTGEDGVARFEARTPTFLSGEIGTVEVHAWVDHPAYGAAERSKPLRLATPSALSVEGIARGGALYPELPSTLYVRLADAAGEPPAVGTPVTVRGPGLRRPAHRQTDVHGLVELDVQVTRADVAVDTYGPCAGRFAAFFDVTVEGPHPRLARICAPVEVLAPARPRVERPVASPGDALRVTIERRPAARGRPVLVALMRGEQTLAVEVTRADEVRFEVPPVLGVLHVLTRVAGEPGRDASAASAAGLEPLLVRPPAPVFPRARPMAPVYEVGEEAEIELRTAPGTGGWFAVNVRDLAQQGGERPFEARFLRGRIRRALLRPDTPSLQRLARASLATEVDPPPPPAPVAPFVDAWGYHDTFDWDGPTPGVDLRDPFAEGLQLVRRELGQTFARIEEAVAQASTDEALRSLTVGEGRRRRFRDDLPIVLGVPDTTLGGMPLTVAALQDADPAFGFAAVARRVSRRRLVRAMVALLRLLRAQEDAAPPPTHWVSALIRHGRLNPSELRDPWGGTLGVRARPAGVPAVSPDVPEQTLAFPGPDGRLGTRDDIVDPFARVVEAGSLYAVYSGEDTLMRTLALMSPADAALEAMLEACQRMTRAQAEAMAGDASSADATEGLASEGPTVAYGAVGLGTLGHGSGYGSGHGTIRRSRRGSPPRIRTGAAAARPSSSLRTLVREEFPGTLFFAPSVPASETGTTRLRFPLAHGATSYLVEVVHWRPDGWIESTSTEVRAAQELSVDAPVPRFATEGDVLVLPLRATNASESARQVQLDLAADGALVADLPEPVEITVPPGEARAHYVQVALRRGSGWLRVNGRAGPTRDAVRRRVRVLPNARPTTIEADGWVEDSEPLTVEVPREASRRRDGILVITSTAGALGPDDSEWTAWARALEGRVRPTDIRAAAARLAADRGEDGAFEVHQPVTTARALAIAYGDHRALPNADLEGLLLELTQAVGGRGRSAAATERNALVLLALAPALQQAEERAGAEALRRLGTMLQTAIQAGAAALSDEPAVQAAVAAALAWTGTAAGRVREYRRRAQRGVVRFSGETWLHGRTETLRSQNWAPTALLALAYLGSGDRAAAFPLVRTLARRAARAPRPTDLGLASAAATLLNARPLRRVTLEIDGERRTVPLHEGSAQLALPGWDRPGRHVLRVVELPPGHALHVHAQVPVGVPWSRNEREVLPLALELRRDGQAQPRAGHFERWTLRVRNTWPRVVREAVVEVSLPAGAELDEVAIEQLRPWLRGRPERDENIVRLHLRALLPGRAFLLPLQLRMSVAGKLHGLGVAAYPSERPRDVAVLPPRLLEVGQ